MLTTHILDGYDLREIIELGLEAKGLLPGRDPEELEIEVQVWSEQQNEMLLCLSSEKDRYHVRALIRPRTRNY